jgi:phosphatidylserine decarboxylase
MKHPSGETWRAVLAPIHPDGWPFVAIVAIVTIVLFIIWQPLGWIGLAGTIWVAIFFRDPWRVSPQMAGLALAPADGEVVAVGAAAAPVELDLGPAPMLRVAIFLSLLDVHINRTAVAGKVTKIVYRKGSFLDARDPESSARNERNAILVATTDGPAAVVQIAGRVARRIRCDLVEGQEVIAGQRIGLIRFGSRAEIYLPADWVPLVHDGQRTVAGETAIAVSPRIARGAPTEFVSQ